MKTRTNKKLMALLLALVMCIGLLPPISAAAAEPAAQELAITADAPETGTAIADYDFSGIQVAWSNADNAAVDLPINNGVDMSHWETEDTVFSAGETYTLRFAFTGREDWTWLFEGDGYTVEETCTVNNITLTVPSGFTCIMLAPLAAGWWYADLTYTAPAPKYEMIAGNAQNIAQDAASAVFTSEADFDKFEGVQIDGITVDTDAYEAEAGSTKITLKATFLRTLSGGKHALTIFSKDGVATTSFHVAAQSEDESDPGDAEAWTITIPVKKIVKKGEGGVADPPAQTFAFEIFSKVGNGDPVTVGTVTATGGENEYTVELALPENMLIGGSGLARGFYLREKQESAEGWAYSDAVYAIECHYDQSMQTNIWLMFPVAEETADSEAAPVDVAEFINTYTNDTPTQPEEDTPDAGIPQTGHNGNAFLWAALMLAAGICFAAITVIAKKNNYGR